MVDTARLSIRVESQEVERGDNRLRQLTASGRGAERATDGLRAGFTRLLGPLATLVATYASFNQLLGVTREFDILNAQLITATGSAEGAAQAFEAIQDFAATTPFDLQQVTGGFTRLVNLGLTPSERALESYGNTSSALGTDLNQLIEAVADAAVGEFERLKEFGIRTQRQGDQVSFTFRGITQTVALEAEAIEGYLIELGEVNFDGAMVERLMTLDGAISNLGDAWNALLLNVSQNGFDDAAQDGVRLAISLIEELNAQVASGELEARITAIANQFGTLSDQVTTSVDTISRGYSLVFESLGLDGNNAAEFIEESFEALPANIGAFIQLIGIEVASLVDVAAATGTAFGQVLGLRLAQLVEEASVYGRALAAAINPFSDDQVDIDAEIGRLRSLTTETADEIFANAERAINVSRDARRAAITDTISDRDAAVQAFRDELAAADELRAEYDRLGAERASQATDRLAQFRAEAAALSGDELRALRDQIFGGGLGRDATVQDEIDQINRDAEARRQAILNNDRLTSEQRMELEQELSERRLNAIANLEAQRAQTIIASSGQILGDLATITAAFAGEQNDTFRTLFALGKAFAIADSTVKIAQGIANAASLPFPANLGAIATVTAATSSIIATIQGARFAGAFQNGGVIPAGSVGLVGETGQPEFVEGPARVTGVRDTARMLNSPGEMGGGNTFVFQMSLGVRAEVRSEIENILPMIVRMVAGATRTGQSQRTAL